ncbi:hypothetical protein CKAH01_02032 [Colletotrichum kahawae]|uniref:Uncharacterized protein n=1 Tax=Colletotrichum kahawae TaxID=34407 RepID=A0AAD9Y288_COLKA|nr:hypothetical protein CKAH01_02032 [Colletotrichum kahawae]
MLALAPEMERVAAGGPSVEGGIPCISDASPGFQFSEWTGAPAGQSISQGCGAPAICRAGNEITACGLSDRRRVQIPQPNLTLRAISGGGTSSNTSSRRVCRRKL